MVHEKIEIKVDGWEKREYQPVLYTYVLDSPDFLKGKKRPAVLICPGGGYSHTSDREAEAVAIQMNAMGFHAFILRYSCAPSRFPTPQLEAAASMLLLRNRAEEWNLDTEKIVILGFSAGGHLAASIGTLYEKELLTGPLKTEPEKIRPAGMILCYPVITAGEFAHRGSFTCLLGDREEELSEFVSLENQVSEDTPPAFLWHTFEDGSVPVENTLLFANAMRKAGVPFELHIYPRGGHGLSLANEETSAPGGNTIVPECQNWITMAGDWIRRL